MLSGGGGASALRHRCYMYFNAHRTLKAHRHRHRHRWNKNRHRQVWAQNQAHVCTPLPETSLTSRVCVVCTSLTAGCAGCRVKRALTMREARSTTTSPGLTPHSARCASDLKFGLNDDRSIPRGQIRMFVFTLWAEISSPTRLVGGYTWSHPS